MGRARIAVIVVLLALLVFVTRYASRQYEIIDWDEDTFMLMAQEVLRGVLPYIRLFDNKPPGMFFTLAGVMAVFGQSVSVVRWFGDACVLATALIVFATARRYAGDRLSALHTGWRHGRVWAERFGSALVRRRLRTGHGADRLRYGAPLCGRQAQRAARWYGDRDHHRRLRPLYLDRTARGRPPSGRTVVAAGAG